MNTAIAHIEISGEIENWWVSDEGRRTICVGHADEMTEAQALGCASLVWQLEDYRERVEAAFRERHPDRQVYHGSLPACDTEWSGDAGWYTYVLKDRRRNGKWQVLEAIT